MAHFSQDAQFIIYTLGIVLVWLAVYACAEMPKLSADHQQQLVATGAEKSSAWLDDNCKSLCGHCKARGFYCGEQCICQYADANENASCIRLLQEQARTRRLPYKVLVQGKSSTRFLLDARQYEQDGVQRKSTQKRSTVTVYEPAKRHKRDVTADGDDIVWFNDASDSLLPPQKREVRIDNLWMMEPLAEKSDLLRPAPFNLRRHAASVPAKGTKRQTKPKTGSDSRKPVDFLAEEDELAALPSWGFRLKPKSAARQRMQEAAVPSSEFEVEVADAFADKEASVEQNDDEDDYLDASEEEEVKTPVTAKSRKLKKPRKISRERTRSKTAQPKHKKQQPESAEILEHVSVEQEQRQQKPKAAVEEHNEQQTQSSQSDNNDFALMRVVERLPSFIGDAVNRIAQVGEAYPAVVEQLRERMRAQSSGLGTDPAGEIQPVVAVPFPWLLKNRRFVNRINDAIAAQRGD